MSNLSPDMTLQVVTHKIDNEKESLGLGSKLVGKQKNQIGKLGTNSEVPANWQKENGHSVVNIRQYQLTQDIWWWVMQGHCCCSLINCYKPSIEDLRYSYGVGVTWITGFGPMSFAISKPTNAGRYEETKEFQFTVGNVF